MQFTCVYCFRFVSVRNLLLNFLQSCGSFFRTLSFRTYSFRIFRVALLFICQGACFDLIEVFVMQSFEDYQRRRRDLNPRAAINDLLPFQGSPFSLLGTSPNKLTNKRYSISIPVDTAEKVGFEPTAPCGVTGFQDQLLKPLGHLSIALSLHGRSHATIDILSSQKPNVNN